MSLVKYIKQCRKMKENRLHRVVFDGNVPITRANPLYETKSKGVTIEYGFLAACQDAFNAAFGRREIIRIDIHGSRVKRSVIARSL